MNISLGTPIEALPPARTRLRVLVVDDSAAQRLLLRTVLERLGLDVVTAPDAGAALDLCASAEGGDIRMILSDWQMPGLDGPAFCRAFRALPRDGYAYFILMTSDTHRAAKAEGLDAGADDFLTRPVDMTELRARVRSGRRILAMQEELMHRNHEVQTTLSDLQAIHDGVSRDLVEGRRMQQAFLPPPRHVRGTAELGLRLLSCNHVGGDLVGYFDLPGDGVALYSIDVSGHGIASALLTGRLSGMFSNRSRRRNVAFRDDGTPATPSEVMHRLNAFMLGEMSTDIYFTAVLAYLDTRSGAMVLCQAGHPHPMVRAAEGTVRAVGDGGPPVGLFDEVEYEDVRLDLPPGAAFLAYSDGVTEAADTWGDMLEEAGLRELLAACDGDAEAVLCRLEAGLAAHVEINGFDDDVSMILVKRAAA